MTDRWNEAISIIAGLLVAALGGWTLLGLTAEEPNVAESVPAAIVSEQAVPQVDMAVPVEPLVVDGVGRSVSDLLVSHGFAERIDLRGELPDSVLRVLEQNNAVLRVAEVTE